MEQVSIVIPVYNTPEKYFHQCMGSVLGQTYQNFEVILFDDGSSNGIEKICDDYAEKDSRIRVIHHKNVGLPGARNRGTRAASGAFLIYLDPDDWWEKDTLEILMQKIRDNDVDIVIFSYFDYFQGGKELERRIWRENHPEFVILDEHQKEKLMKGMLDSAAGDTPGCFGSACMQIAKFDFIRRSGVYFKENLRKTEDLPYELELLKKPCKAAVLDRPFYHYRHHDASVCNRYNPDISEISNEVNRELVKFSEKESKEFGDTVRVYMMKSYINILRLDFFHQENRKSYLVRRGEWRRFVKTPGYFAELKEGSTRTIIQSRKLLGLFFIVSFRFRSFLLLSLLYRIFIDRL